MSTMPIMWDEEPKRLAADPAATLRLDRKAWEALGASFSEVDDGQGEMPGLATATVTTPAGPLSVGVLDYQAESTYLLVPGADPERFAWTAAVLEALEAAGAIRLDMDLLDLADSVPVPTLEQRVMELEQKLAELGGSETEAAKKLGARSRRGRKRAKESEPIIGAVKWFSDDKGFGFIEPDEESIYSVDESSVKLHGIGQGRSIVGTVKWFDDKGFGAITPDDGSEDLLMHHRVRVGEGYRSLIAGTKIALEVEEASPPGRKKGRAK